MIQSITRGSSRARASVSLERAAITGEVGSAVRGAPSGSIAPREADVTAGLADDQLAGGGVDSARAPQRDHPVEPGRRHLAQRRGDRAQRTQAVGAVRPARRSRPRSSGGRPTRCRAPRAGRRVRGARGRVGSRGAPSSQAPRPRHAHHCSRGPKSWTKAKATSAIVCAVGHRDRKRIARDAALGVQRPVDRIDDDPHRLGRRSRSLRAPRTRRGTGSPPRAGRRAGRTRAARRLDRSPACGRRRCRGCRSRAARSLVVGTSASMRSRPVTARRQTASQSASSAERVEVMADLCCQTWRSP